MFVHNKRLQYTVRVGAPNPGLANLLLEQFGGPQGELAAAMRYFTQAVSEDDPGRKDLLFDIATEELSHLEIIGSIVAMPNKGAKGQLAEAVEQEADLYRSLTGAGNDSHITQVLYGAGSPLTNPAGVPWTAAYIATIGEPTADLRSNIAAEARAKIVYERLINVTDDAGIKEAHRCVSSEFRATRRDQDWSHEKGQQMMINAALVIRWATGVPCADEGILVALRRQGILIRRADLTLEGMSILCQGEVKTLRLCAEHLASLSFVAGVSMQRCDDDEWIMAGLP
ncbi:manganese catalase family protein [Caballeronia cordobensis]|uniref:manganese catalase family protein n=1 Tax=Caballeronia cordobensis TaxID=1353886 RepID=UPI000AEB73F1|nr:manganese catalase family protein [Caballeronia cordobensis]